MVKEDEQFAYQWACTRAHIVANLLQGITIKEDSVESSTWDRFSVALEAIDCAIALLGAVTEALKAISASADDNEVVQLTLATTTLKDMCRVVHRQLDETAPKVEKAAKQHRHKNQGNCLQAPSDGERPTEKDGVRLSLLMTR